MTTQTAQLPTTQQVRAIRANPTPEQALQDRIDELQEELDARDLRIEFLEDEMRMATERMDRRIDPVSERLQGLIAAVERHRRFDDLSTAHELAEALRHAESALDA